MSVNAWILRADARALPLADASVDCVVTSPPYWGLRDYGAPGQIGLECTPELYVATLLEVFAEVWRVLKPTGTLWLNLGDSYSGSGMTGGTNSKEGSAKREDRMFRGNRRDTIPGLKPKDLVGIPWRMAFALQAAGWWLRSDIIWAKPNPMPESVTDRPTKAHEYLFLFAKGKTYYYDARAIAEPFADDRMGNPGGGGHYVRNAYNGAVSHPNAQSGLARGFWNTDRAKTHRNRRSVWTILTSTYTESHFATFPPALVRPCILAGCPVGGTVLDPFGGTGTVGQVALELHRNAVLVDLKYHDLAQRRLAATQPGLAL